MASAKRQRDWSAAAFANPQENAVKIEGRTGEGVRDTGRMKDIETLNTVIETLKDGQEGFRAAGEDIDSPELRSLFSTFSRQRATFAAELQRLARAYGDKQPEDKGSVAGVFHRGWIDLRAAIASRNAHAILAECERGEDSAV